MNVYDTIKIILLIGIYTGLLLTYIKISEIEANIDFILKRDWQRKDDKAESEEKEEISKDDAIKIVHDTIHDFFVDSETFNDKEKFLLKINKAICNNIMGY